jgi:ABC-type branched-subunit amino acid transport system ATPase component
LLGSFSQIRLLGFSGFSQTHAGHFAVAVHDGKEAGPSTIVELRNIHKTYLLGIEGVPALRGVTVSITKGEFVVILGKSGGGKTTMLNVIGTCLYCSGYDCRVPLVTVPQTGDELVFDVGLVAFQARLTSRRAVICSCAIVVLQVKLQMQSWLTSGSTTWALCSRYVVRRAHSRFRRHFQPFAVACRPSTCYPP